MDYILEKELKEEIFTDEFEYFFTFLNDRFEYAVELSTRPEKRIGDERIWDKAEKVLEEVLKKNKMKY
jgi:threonyl-tRNA synthetase